MRALTLVLASLLLSSSVASAWDCYDTWSRCSGWSSPATGILWQNCNTHCQGCFNAAHGKCNLVGTTTCMGVNIPSFQCQCFGTWSGSDKPACGI
eukprot:m51a1_g1465 hypothetical protein (95) ;mRNA; r:232884-233168